MTIEDFIEDKYLKGAHDNIVKKVVSRLEDSGLYDCVKHNVKYYLPNTKQYGEADVLAKAGERYFAFEIKSSHRGKNKAIQQLRKDSRLLEWEGMNTQPYLYRVYGSKGNSVYERIKYI